MRALLLRRMHRGAETHDMRTELHKARFELRTSWANPPASPQDFVAVVHFAQGKTGLVFNKKRNSWEFPGGHVETGDASLLEAARREYSEETGGAAPGNLKYSFTVKNTPLERPERYSFCHFFRCETAVPPTDRDLVFHEEIPRNTSFHPAVYDKVLDELYSMDPLPFEENHAAWEALSPDYLTGAKFSCDDIHFGPCIPGNSRQGLVRDIEGKSVLDLGCGIGHNSIVLSRSGAKVSAIDFSESQISRARGLAGSLRQNIKFYCSDFESGIAQAGNGFSMILSVFSLQFSNDFRYLAKKVYDVLAPGGAFVFSLPHPAGMLSGRQGVRIVKKDWGNGIYISMRYYSAAYLLSVLKDSGFDGCLAIEPRHDTTDLAAPYSSEYYTQKLACRADPYTLIISAKKTK